MKRDAKRVIARLEAAGLVVLQARRGGHHTVYRRRPDGSREWVTTIPASPSDRRWWLNARADLRRKGVDLGDWKP